MEQLGGVYAMLLKAASSESEVETSANNNKTRNQDLRRAVSPEQTTGQRMVLTHGSI